MTAATLIGLALKRIQVYAPGATVSTGDQDDCLAVLQSLMASWAQDLLLNPKVIIEPLALVIGQVAYTIGESGTGQSLDTVRPYRIISGYVRDSGNYDYPVHILGEAAYSALSSKSETVSRPTSIWYNPTYPNGTLYVWPAPSAIENLYLTSEKPFTVPETAASTLDIPAECERLITLELAVEIAPMFEKDVSTAMQLQLQSARAAVKSLNATRLTQPAFLEVPGLGKGSVYNILTE